MGGQLRLPPLQRTGYIPLPITAAKLIASNAISAIAVASGNGGQFASDTAPILERVNGATDKALRLRWVATDVAEIQFAPVDLPPDLDDTADVTVHLSLGKSANVNTTMTIDVQAFFGIGDTECGAVSSAITNTTPAEKIVTIAAADVPAAPATLNISLVPGAHASDSLYLYSAWVEYTKTSG